jgi:hypothetical protein
MSAVYEWMHNEQVFSGLVGTVLVAAMVPLTAWLVTRISVSRSQTSFQLNLIIPQALRHMPFFVRHIRDGAARWSGGEAFKEDRRFPAPGPDGVTSQRLVFPRRVGVLFKVYVEFQGMDFPTVRNHLTAAGYLHISQGDVPHTNRAWFILPRHTTVTHDNITDNFYLD